MCGIFGYVWKKDVVPILLTWLQRLEYRGYDSAGILVRNADNQERRRAVGKVAYVTQAAQDLVKKWFTSGIAHTRWATHGWVTEKNTHPHMSNNGKRAVVHNGIIENYAKLKKELENEGVKFNSDTDTEVIAHLLQKYMTGDALQTIKIVQNVIRWAYALLIAYLPESKQLYAVKLGSPLIYAYNDTEQFFSSDAQALSWYAKKMVHLEDGDLIHLYDDSYTIYSNGSVTKRDIETFDQEALEASKWDYKHFMLKEIYEQPAIIKRTYKWRIGQEHKSLHADAFHGMGQEDYKSITTVGCGTAFHAWWLWTCWFQNIAWIKAHAEIASEYENKPFFVSDDALHLFVSQSGETADSLDVLKMIKQQWGKSFGVVNVVGSSIARLTDSGLYLRAGTEIWVASTKAFTAQSLCLLLLALFLGKRRWMRLSKYQQIMKELEHLPSYIETVLDQSDHIRSIAMDLIQYKDFFFLGRGYQYPIAAESSLKFKEITYLHSEAYAAGELKHGSLALISDQVPTIFNLPHDELFEQNLSSVQEIKAREGKVCVISDKRIQDANRQITIPETIDEIYPFLTAVAGQLLK